MNINVSAVIGVRRKGGPAVLVDLSEFSLSCDDDRDGIWHEPCRSQIDIPDGESGLNAVLERVARHAVTCPDHTPPAAAMTERLSR